MLNHLQAQGWECNAAGSSKILVQELKLMFGEQLKLDRYFMDKHLFRDEADTERVQKIIKKIQQLTEQKKVGVQDKMNANLRVEHEELLSLTSESHIVASAVTMRHQELGDQNRVQAQKKATLCGEQDKVIGAISELETRRNKLYRLNEILAEKDAVIEKLGGNININDQNIPYMYGYKAMEGDQVDQMLAMYINQTGIQLPITRLGQGFYMFGSRKIYGKIMNNKLIVKTGGGFLGIDEFIKAHGESEVQKLKRFTPQQIQDMHTPI